MNLPASKRLFGLDVLRSTAIALVLLSHTSFIFPVSPAGKSFIFIFCGFIGVELFFVLSGYLIGAILLNLITDEEFTWPKLKLFWIRRWFRTLPAYYLVLLLTVLFYYFISRGFVLNDWYNWLYFIFGQNFFAPHPSFFTVAWSLSIEEWFYLLLPITFYFSRKRLMYHKRITMIILAWIFLITLLRIAIVYTRNPSWDFGIRMMVPFRLDSLMTGVLAAWVKIRFSNVWSRYTNRFFYAGVLMLVICSWWLYIDVIRTDIKAGFFSKTFLFNFFSLGVALCLPFLAAITEPRNKYIARPVHFVSYISYSLYLTHSMVIYVCVAVCNKFKILPAAAPRLLFVFTICMVVAAAMYRFYEKPFTNLRDKYGYL